MRTSWLIITLVLTLAACADDRFDHVPAYTGGGDDGSNQTTQLALEPTVEAIEKDALVIGETVYFYGDNFLHPDDGGKVIDGIDHPSLEVWQHLRHPSLQDPETGSIQVPEVLPCPGREVVDHDDRLSPRQQDINEM